MILTSEDDWRGAIGFDAFAERIMIRRACPAGEPGPWNDLADLKAANWLQQSRWKLDVSAPKVSEAVPEAAHRCTFHPLRDKLNSLRWDAVPRLATWLSVYLGAEDTPVHRAIASTWMLGAVSRAFSPGCQVDAALVLEGIQGAGKSSALRTLALGFFTDELADIGSKDAAMQLHGAWIVELSELDALSRAEVTRVKSFITRRVERFRAPYGRHIAEHPRSCVFAGTTNQSDYLRDDSGNRRWLPVLCGPVRLDELRRDVDLLWAEAVILYRDNGDTYIKDPSLLRDLRIHTDKRYQGDAWTDVVLNYANARESVSVGEVLEHVGVDRGRWSRSDETRVAKILKSEGFERHRATVGEARQWRYFRDYNGRALDGLGR
jgi:predicted P-loop ATPase